MKRFLLIFGLFPAITFAAPIIVRPAPVRIPAKPAPARPAKPAHSDNSAVVPIAAIVATQNIRTQNRNIGGTTCLVVKVSDGDTFSCNKGYDNIIQVRLADIDAPESGQAYGNQARKALNKLIYKQAVTLKNERKDKYGRTVATVFSGSTNVNLTMIEQGMRGTTIAIQTTPNTPPQCDKHRLKSVGCGRIKARLLSLNNGDIGKLNLSGSLFSGYLFIQIKERTEQWQYF